jgi:hypothetical protein
MSCWPRRVLLAALPQGQPGRAAPHVTGLVGRMLSEHPHLTPYEVKTVLRAAASNAERKDGGCNGG